MYLGAAKVCAEVQIQMTFSGRRMGDKIYARQNDKTNIVNGDNVVKCTITGYAMDD